MPICEQFQNALLPGNYALTKSMELTKKNDSGTLWYTKKFLVLYYYIFLTDDIYERAYIPKVTAAFDSYIDGLPEEVRETARTYFYPDNPAVNLKAEGFKTFAAFARKTEFATKEERTKHFQEARKYYFALLMGSGGQRGVKKYLKEILLQPQFTYSKEHIREALQEAVVRVCVEEGNASGTISDNSVKYLVSDTAIEKINKLSSAAVLTRENVRALLAQYPHPNPNYKGIANDMAAFIRNERQVLYYYGYFHSKTSGASDFEFSSLTPVGEIALNANDAKFLAVWEHQKIKMVSQPAVSEIKKVSSGRRHADKFAISFTPYMDILSHLRRHRVMTLEQYKYIVSRKKHIFSQEEWLEGEEELLAHLEEMRETVHAFGRDGDKKDEDGRKELLKYILGIRCDLPKDRGTNPLGVCGWGSAGLCCTDTDSLKLLCDIYGALDDYKIQKYGDVLQACEEDLKRRYMQACQNENERIDARVKISWDLYNIHVDNLILLGTILAIACSALGIYEIRDIQKDALEQISDYVGGRFKNLLKRLGMTSKSRIREEMRQVHTALRDGAYMAYLEHAEEREEVVARYLTTSSADLWDKIQTISEKADISISEDKSRNASLVSYLKSYYITNFLDNHTLKCEGCGEEAFLTDKRQPYVEFHHLIPFKKAYGPDHYLNLFALCANCHRKVHYMSVADKEQPYAHMSRNNYLRQDFKERLRKLNGQKLLRSYHMEYLLTDHAITQAEYDDITVSP